MYWSKLTQIQRDQVDLSLVRTKLRDLMVKCIKKKYNQRVHPPNYTFNADLNSRNVTFSGGFIANDHNNKTKGDHLQDFLEDSISNAMQDQKQ